MRIARNKFVGSSNSIRNALSSWNHLGSYNNKCQHGKQTGKPKEENMHDKLKKINKAREADKEELRQEFLSMMQAANGHAPFQQVLVKLVIE